MKIFIEKDYDAMSEKALCLFRHFLPGIGVLGLATGNTVLGFYERICREYANGNVSLKGIKTLNLDEYFGISPDHRESYRTYMNTNLFSRVDINIEDTHLPDPGGDPGEAAERYNAVIDSLGPPDLQVLGIGQNGHIAFNEPMSPREARTRVVLLTQDTIDVNRPPSGAAITMGMKDILKSRRLLILASGKSKAEAVSNMVDGPMTYKVPASFLQDHPQVYAVIDEEAASRLDVSYIKEQNRRYSEFSGNPELFDV